MTPVKMQPFWWFLRPPYVYPCWFDECEDLSSWTIDPLMEGAIDGTNKKQGSYSIKIKKPYIPDGTPASSYRSVTQCADYLGFWIRATLPDVNANVRVYWQKANGAYVSIGFFHSAVGTPFTYDINVYDPAAGSYSFGTWAYTEGEWLWIEFFIDSTTVRPYVNGVGVGSSSGRNVYPVYREIVGGYTIFPLAYVWLDWQRWFPTLEYPPTYPY
jgi:hypothetical protein